MKKQSFITGAVILMAANAVSKILGAVLKIPLAYILREEGMAVYSIAFEVYIMFLAFVISGLPFAISKLSAEASSTGNIQRERKIVTLSTWLLALIGVAGSVLLYFAAPFFALAMKEEKAVYAIRMISPSVFFVALGTGYKSYFQGVSRMIPVAVSQVAESLVKLAAGYGLALLFVRFGVERTAGGAIMGVTAGEIIATAILAFSYIFGKKEDYRKSETESSRAIIGDLMSLALPLLCASVVSNVVGIADTTMTRTRLLDAGFTAEGARFLYGAYTGYALTVFHLPVGILATLGISILPVIAGAYASGNTKKARIATDRGIKISVILSVPCSVIMYSMSGEILELLFKNSSAAQMLKVVAPCAVMMCAVQMTAAILQSAGEIMTPFFNALAGSAVKLALGYFLTGNPDINIYGSPVSAIVSYSVIMLLNFISIRRRLGIKLDLVSIIVKPVLCGAVMLAAVSMISRYFDGVGAIIRIAAAGGLALGVYAATLLLTSAVSVSELRDTLR